MAAVNNTWPDGHRRAMYPHEHEAWNSVHWPGTRQLCVICDCETDRCEEDELTIEDGPGPLCEACYKYEMVKLCR